MENLITRVPNPSSFQFGLCTIINGKKFRTVGDKVYETSINGTFHQFLQNHAIELLGSDWWIEQEETKSEDEQCCLFKWANEFYKAGTSIKIQHPHQKMIAIPNTGTRLCWMLFCYDLLCLEHRGVLTEKLIRKLRAKVSFQSARYELAIAAVVIRADCDLVWIKSKEKSCEFIATHRETSWSFGVEAKSKHYPKVYNEPEQGVNKGRERLNNLLKKALKQAPRNTGFLIFIDQNLDGSNDSKLMHLANSVLKNCIKPSSPENPSIFSSIIFTNFPFHYLDNGVVKYALACPPHPKYPMPTKVQQAIEDSLYYYSYIPNEI